MKSGFQKGSRHLSGKEGVVEEEKPHEQHADPLLLPIPLSLLPNVQYTQIVGIQ